MAIPENTRPLAGPAPRLNAPPGATDCHMHFFLDGFEAQPGGPPVAELATPADYAQVQKRLGLERLVISQPNAYQFDNRATLAALDMVGTQTARALIVVTPDMAVKDLEALHTRGVRGARIMDVPGGAVGMTDMPAVARLAHAVGWHMMVQFAGRDIDNHRAALEAVECDYIIDHAGRFAPPVAADDPRVDTLLRLVDRGNAWVKLAGAEDTSVTGPPAFADLAPVARRIVAHAPERVLWGSNWPHVGVPRESYPDDAELFDLLLDWADDATIRRILVDNPATLYGFGRE